MFKFYWTDDPEQMAWRTKLGITWDELPALGVNTLEHVVWNYPRGQAFEKELLDKWLRSVHKGRQSGDADESRVTEFAKQMGDTTIQEYFLDNALYADRQIFTDEILRQEVDAVVFMYSSENINYLQRKACYQVNMLAELLSSGVYGNLVPNKLKFYAYDANKHSLPRGIPHMTSPPEDIYGTKTHSKE